MAYGTKGNDSNTPVLPGVWYRLIWSSILLYNCMLVCLFKVMIVYIVCLNHHGFLIDILYFYFIKNQEITMYLTKTCFAIITSWHVRILFLITINSCVLCSLFCSWSSFDKSGWEEINLLYKTNYGSSFWPFFLVHSTVNIWQNLCLFYSLNNYNSLDFFLHTIKKYALCQQIKRIFCLLQRILLNCM